MKRFRKYSLQIAAAAILAVVLTLAAPRAVHAVTAALVNVTNTAASPAISQGVNRLASQNVYLTTGFSVNPGATVILGRLTPDGVFSSSFVVPSGQSLVVTQIELLTSTSSGDYTFELINGVSGNVRKVLRVALVSYTTEFQYPSGIVFPAGETVGVFNGALNPSHIDVNLHGYLTSN